ncbi:MAG: holin family protein [Pseudomonadota bacterium]
MGLISQVFSLLFGGGGNVIRDTAEVFRENAENASQRDAAMRGAALAQFAAEFAVPRQGVFDRLLDSINRLPRPALALGTLALFVSAMVDPVWFAARMTGIALVPEPLWWLLGVIVSFYFGARHQAKSHAFQRSLAQTMAQAPTIAREIAALEAETKGRPASNPVLAEWRDSRG